VGTRFQNLNDAIAGESEGQLEAWLAPESCSAERNRVRCDGPALGGTLEVNILLGKVLGGEVSAKIHIGEVIGGSAKADKHIVEGAPAADPIRRI